MPYLAQPEFGTSGGKTGVFLVPSDHPTATPAMVTSSAVPSGALGFLLATTLEEYLTDAAGAVSQTIVSSGYYVIADSTANHLYRLDLRDTSKVPSPVEVGLPPTPVSTPCGIAVFEQTLNLPSSAVILVKTGGADGNCETDSDNLVYLYYAGDGARVAPAVTPIASTSFYQSTATPVNDPATGNLAGLIYIDAHQNLSFSDLSFAAPKILVTGATAYSLVYTSTGYAFVEVVTAGKSSLYRVSSTGAISSDLYDFQPSNQVVRAIADAPSGYLWVEDSAGNFDSHSFETSYSVQLARLPLSGSAVAQVIYSASGTLPAGYRRLMEAYAVGVAGSSFIFDLEAFGFNAGAPAQPATMYALPVNAAVGTAPAAIASLPSGWFGSNQVVHDQLFVTVHNVSGPNSSGISNSVEVLDSAGTVLKNFAKSIYEGSSTVVTGTPLAPRFLQSTMYVAEGYTASTSSYDAGGATAYALSTSTLTQVPLTVPGGGNYVLAPGEEPGLYSDGPAVVMNADYDSSFNASAGVLDVLQNQWTAIANPPSTVQQPFDEAGPGFGPAGSGL